MAKTIACDICGKATYGKTVAEDGRVLCPACVRNLGLDIPPPSLENISPPQEKRGDFSSTDKSENESFYNVRVMPKALNVREGAGIEYKVVSILSDNPIIRITQVIKCADGTEWGRIVGKDGWIMLEYTTKVE